MFWIYWYLILATAIALAILAKKNGCVANYMGVVLAHLKNNNNWRWGALGILTVIFTISAVLAGFGRPLLTSSAKEVKISLAEELDSRPVAAGEIQKLWRGTNGTPTKVVAIEKKYSSWWHWKVAIMLWLAWLIYTPFAFRDEAMGAIKAAIKAVERRKRLNNIRASSTTTAIVTPTQTAPTESASVITKSNLFGQLLRVEVLTEALEIFFKLLIKRAGGLFH